MASDFYATVKCKVKWVDPIRTSCAVQGCTNDGLTCNSVVCSTDFNGATIPGLPQYVKLYLCDTCYEALKSGVDLYKVSVGYKPPKILDPFDFTECSANTAPYPTTNGIQYGTKPHAVEYCRCMECASARYQAAQAKTLKGE